MNLIELFLRGTTTPLLSFSAKYHLSYGRTRPAYTSWLLQVETHRVLWMWQLCFIQSHWLYVPCMQPARAFILRCLDCPLLIGKESPCWLIKNYSTGHCWPLSHTHICTTNADHFYVCTLLKGSGKEWCLRASVNATGCF